MKFLIKSISIFLFLLGIENLTAQEATLILKLRNIEIIQGNILVSLTNDSSQFANFSSSQGSRVQKVGVKSSEQDFVFEGLKTGWYAIAVFQDLNENDSLDTKRFRIPAEPFGFSNNALARFRPPWFKSARFYVDGNKPVIQDINLIYRKPKKVKTDLKKNENQ